MTITNSHNYLIISRYFIFVCLFFVINSQLVAADLLTADQDWCTIQYPAKVKPEQSFTVTVTPKQIDNNLLIGGDLHNATTDNYIGFVAWGGNPKPAKSNTALTFTYKMPKFVSPDQGVQPIFYLTPKDWATHTKLAYCPVILPLVDANTAVSASIAASAAPTATAIAPPVLDEKTGLSTVDRGWCTIQYPAKVKPEQNFTVIVTPKQIDNNLKIGGDLHNATIENGVENHTGFAAWGGNPKSAKSNTALTFTYKMPKFVSANTGVHPIFYLTAQGWNEQVGIAYCPVILPLVTTP